MDYFYFYIYAEQREANAGCVSQISGGEELESGSEGALCAALTFLVSVCCIGKC